jgi:uncharacterized protein YciI
MRILLLLTVLSSLAYSAIAQEINPGYDSTLAKSLGADEYGMKAYILVILKTGDNKVEDKAVRDSLFAGHFENINRMAENGKLLVAGPLGKNDNLYRGIFILNTASFEEAKELLQNDPTVKENIFKAEYYNWYGSAALPVYLETHKKIEKYKVK